MLESALILQDQLLERYALDGVSDGLFKGGCPEAPELTMVVSLLETSMVLTAAKVWIHTEPIFGIKGDDDGSEGRSWANILYRYIPMGDRFFEYLEKALDAARWRWIPIKGGDLYRPMWRDLSQDMFCCKDCNEELGPACFIGGYRRCLSCGMVWHVFKRKRGARFDPLVD